MNFKLIFAKLTLLFLLVPISMYAQNSQEQTIKVNSKLVVLDAQVIDNKTNKPINGLKKEDFQLYDEKALQDVTFFKEESLPLSIIFLVESNALAPIFEKTRLEEWPISQYLKPQDEVAVMAFGAQTKLLQSFTKDKTTIIKKFKELPKIEGRLNLVRTAVYDASLLMRRANNPVGRRAIIVLTTNISQEPILNTGAIATKDETLEQLYESGSIVTSLVFGSAGDKLNSEILKRKYPDQILISKFFSKSNINIFANQTGGEVLPASKDDFLDKMSSQIDNLRTRYSLAFIPNTETESGNFREIELKLSSKLLDKDYKIKTKRGYYPNRPTFASFSELILPKVNGRVVTRPYKIVDLMPLLLEFLAKIESQDVEIQTKLFRETFINKYPEVFSKKILNLSEENFDSNLDKKIQVFLTDLKKHNVSLRRLAGSLATDFLTNEEKFLSRFPDLKWDGTIYLLPSLSSFTSKEEVINDQKVVLFGIDTLAFTKRENAQFWPIFHHQLFHLYHQQFEPKAKHLNLELPLYDFMWNEGMACYITGLLNPEVDRGEIIQLGSIKQSSSLELSTIIKIVRDNLTLPSDKFYYEYFGLDTSLNEKYINSGNYLCFLTAEQLLLGQPLTKILRIPAEERQKIFDFLLRKVELQERKTF